MFAVGSLAWNNMNFDTEASNKFSRIKDIKRSSIELTTEAEYINIDETSGSLILHFYEIIHNLFC